MKAKKTTGGMDALLRLRLPAEDKEAFEDAARRMRVSLSAWMRIAGLEKIERDPAPRAVRLVRSG